MYSFLLLAPAVLLGADVHGTYEAGARAEVRARTPIPTGTTAAGVPTSRFAGDVELSLNGALGATLGNTYANLSYSPRFLLQEPSGPEKIDVFHSAALGVGFRFRPRGNAFANTSIRYGRTQFTLLATPDGTVRLPDTSSSRGVDPGIIPGGAPEAGSSARASTPPRSSTSSSTTSTALLGVPALLSVRYFDSESTAGFDFWPGQRVRTALSGGYAVSGGVDFIAQLGMPLQRGPLARGTLELVASPRDTFSTQLSFNYSEFSSGQTVSVAQATETWRHGFSARTRIEAEAGAASLRSRPAPGRPFDLRAQGVGSLTAFHNRAPLRGHNLEGSLGVIYAPLIDRFRATILERLELNANVLWAIGKDWTLSVRGNAGQTLSGPTRGEKAFLLDFIAGHRLDRMLSLEVGLRNGWQRSPTTAIPTAYQWLALVALAINDKGTF